MIKVLVIAPYEGLLELTKEIAEEINDIAIDTKLGNLDDAIKIAKLAEMQGYDVIISRGGTASMIEEIVSIPVINIQVSGYDVLSIITLFKGLAGNAAIVGYPNITKGATMICSLLDINIKTITLEKSTNVKEKLLNLKESNYEIIIGDVITVQAAKELGLNGVLITSGREAILLALEEARRVFRLFLKLKNNVLMYQSILRYDKNAIVIVNNDHDILFKNDQFQKEIPNRFFEDNSGIFEMIEHVTLNQEEQSRMIYHLDQMWSVRGVPLNEMVGLYVKMEFDHVKNNNDDISKFHSIGFETSIPYAVLHGKSKEIKAVLHQVEMYSKIEESVWITGESGNGKGIVAQLIYSKWKKENEFLITLDCELLTNKQWNFFVAERFFTKNKHALVYLKAVDRLDPSLQKELYHLLKSNKKDQIPRFISSSDETIEYRVRDGIFNKDLFHVLSSFTIHISPLRDRSEDIEQLVHVFISEAHVKYGKQVVGIRKDALTKLMEYDWPGNGKQLRKVVEQLVVQSKFYYIELEEVEQTLTKTTEIVSKCNINLSGTLAEIEKQVISHVLEEEEMNQSKAAKRLGVNRSTLWRKLK
ncbi:PrpR N-terminal domain-containing protein [Bacillaceae bacterium IKA-2]|nr:PrpR N-terminal domain-containing protein [Bacillaceae bacterium IKA-2]